MIQDEKKKKRKQADGKDTTNLGFGPSTLYYFSCSDIYIYIYNIYIHPSIDDEQRSTNYHSIDKIS